MSGLDHLCPGCFVSGGARPCPKCGYKGEGDRPRNCLPALAALPGGLVVGRLLGKPGSFGITYLGWDRLLQRKVAIKEYLPRELASRDPGDPKVRSHSVEDEGHFRYGLEKFVEEARILAGLDHPNIVRVQRFFEENGTGYLVMDYYEGTSLDQILPGGKRLPEAKAVDLLLPILEALSHIHGKGFVHRDVKPSNIYLKGGSTPILLDFGAARMSLGERTKSTLASSGYAPIEQYNLHGKLGPWTDVYAAAATLYRMLTGETPLPADSRVEEDKLEWPEQLVPGLSSRLAWAVREGLAIRKEDRIQDAGSFIGLLRPTSRPLAPSQSRLAPPVTVLKPSPSSSPAKSESVPSPPPKEPATPSMMTRPSSTSTPLIEDYFPPRRSFPVENKPASPQPVPETPLPETPLPEAPPSSTRAGRAALYTIAGLDPLYSPPSKQPTSSIGSSKQNPFLSSHKPTRLDVLISAWKDFLSYLPAIGCLSSILLFLGGSIWFVLIIQPVAIDDQAETSGSTAVHIPVLDNDQTRFWSHLRLVSVGPASNGKTHLRPGGTITYTPSPGFAGLDRFSYTVTNDSGHDDAEVLVTVLKAGDVRRNEKDGLEYAWIPPGKFIMGCTEVDEPCEDNERPSRWVVLARGFWLGTTEVTNAAFNSPGAPGMKVTPPRPISPKHPKVEVSWFEAEAFCEWSGGRLPTEAEWEYAARSGENRRFPWGNLEPTEDKDAVNGAAFKNVPIQVASFRPNAFSLFDMAGNVWEWCEDAWHPNYEGAPLNGSAWVSGDDSRRVERGGAWQGAARFLRAAERSANRARNRGHLTGFRCARDTPPLTKPPVLTPPK